jgi:hypothetical protein
MMSTPKYSIHIQSQIILALCVLHNFICVHDPDDLNIDLHDLDEELNCRPCHHGPENYRHHVLQAESDKATLFHNKIAKAMWQQY